MNPTLSLGRLISCIYRHTQTYLSRELMDYSIGSGQFSFLMVLQNNEGVSQDHIAQALHIDKATTTRALKKLEKAGYISRQKDTADKRRYNVYLTEKGRDMYPVILKISAEWTDLLLEGISEEGKQQLFTMLTAVMNNATAEKRCLYE